MRVAVMGAGAIGILYGGWLHQGGADVTFIARGQRLNALRTSTLSAEGKIPFKIDRIKTAESPQELDPVDVVLLCVKLYDVDQAAAFATPALKPGGTLIGIQNGVNVLDSLKRFLPARQLAVGSVYSVTKLIDPTTATYGGLERVVIGNPEADISDGALELLKIWQSVGVDAEQTKEIRSVLWQKFIGVATGSAINCVTRLPAGIVYHDETILPYVRQAIDEVIAVGRAAGVNIPPAAAESTLAFLKTFPFDAVASMRLDLDAGRKLELEGLSGEVVRLGHLLSVRTPFHKMSYDILRPFQDGPVRHR